MDKAYTNEKNILMLIALMKVHGIRKIVASPGTTNYTFIASVQQDDFFEIYSSVDERSAAYIACGLAAESGEPVALSCTGATASRNYMPGLTEAFYRKLPILAITSTQSTDRIGHNIPQVIDRMVQLNDTAKTSIQLPVVHSDEDFWSCEVKINKALLELKHRGNGPVHINITTTYSKDFSVRELPKVRKIDRISYEDKLPEIIKGKIGIFVGAHSKWSEELTQLAEAFCSKYNAIIFGDHTSNYKGKYWVSSSLINSQIKVIYDCEQFDLIIHLGDVSGSSLSIYTKNVWRVNPDGKIRDTFNKLTCVFEMSEKHFFSQYLNNSISNSDSFLKEWIATNEALLVKVPELPFSNVWVAQKTSDRLPENSVLHLGILNSLRSWNLFNIPNSVLCYSNTGGFGIDGCISSLLGAAIANKDKLYYGVVGDLAFFYDMNSIGNRHVGNNIRLLLINNGRGTEFRNYNNPIAVFSDKADEYMAAYGHFGSKSPCLVKNYAENLGFTYLSASTKDEYLNNLDCFLNSEKMEKPILFEVFTNSQDESDALEIMHNIDSDAKGIVKKMAKDVLGEKGVSAIKKILKR